MVDFQLPVLSGSTHGTLLCENDIDRDLSPERSKKKRKEITDIY
jgi:hypothetical protein